MTTPPAPRLEVRKTYKLYVGGASVRSESGHGREGGRHGLEGYLR